MRGTRGLCLQHPLRTQRWIWRAVPALTCEFQWNKIAAIFLSVLLIGRVRVLRELGSVLRELGSDKLSK